MVVILLVSISCQANLISSEADAQKKFVEQWGVKVLGIRRTASDYMLDFRFRIVDPQKAAVLIDRKIKPHIIVEESGAKLEVPITSKLGPLRQSGKFAQANKNYFVFFANPGRTVHKGDRVTVNIGDFSVSHLVVE